MVSPNSTYLVIQPLIEGVSWVAQMGFLSDDGYPDPAESKPEDRFSSLEEAIQASAGRAKLTDLGIKVVTEPWATGHSGTYADEETLAKVYTAMMKLKVPRDSAIAIVHAMQAEGILFRERTPENHHDGVEPSPLLQAVDEFMNKPQELNEEEVKKLELQNGRIVKVVDTPEDREYQEEMNRRAEESYRDFHAYLDIPDEEPPA